jgi:para-nitrobenzyl esterase
MMFGSLKNMITLTLGVAAAPLIATGTDRAPVRIDTGLLAGVPGRTPNIAVYKGIPYAAAPVGNLRWRAPERAKPWRGVRTADSFGNLCPQLAREPVAQPMSEDCLTANVWTGAGTAGELRPVFVWIYGGGFSQGTGSSPQFDGEGLARKGVVVVTFNYRLGPLGFLATPELSKESGHGASGNYGLLDDVALLQWVQRNIAAFGGDPGRVTIAGQSAGAGSVGFLSMSPLARGLFHRSIAQSHARHPGDLELRYLSTSWRPLNTAEQAGTRYVTARGATSLATMRALPWQKLIEGSDLVDADVYTGSTARPPLFRPVVDGWVIPHSYGETLGKGMQNPVNYIAGSNLDETGAVPATAFATLRARTTPPRPGMPQTNVTLATYRDWAKTKFGAMADDFLRLYPATNDDEAALANNDAARDNSRVSTWLWGTLWKRTAETPIFTYFWTHAAPGPSRDLRGAYHGSEINYVFDNLYATDLPWIEADRKIADIMSSYWANIAAKGDPNGPGLPVWPAYDPASPTVMEVGDNFAPMPVASPDKIGFWKRFFAAQQAW